MTEKRFTINTIDGSIDLRDNGKVMTYKETVDLLNMLHEENTNLKFELDLCKNPLYSRRKLEEENEQLKQELKNLRKLVNEMYMEGSE